jgi:hypothetical protein
MRFVLSFSAPQLISVSIFFSVNEFIGLTKASSVLLQREREGGKATCTGDNNLSYLTSVKAL